MQARKPLNMFNILIKMVYVEYSNMATQLIFLT